MAVGVTDTVQRSGFKQNQQSAVRLRLTRGRGSSVCFAG